jgi:hypothetical protein
MSKNLFNLYIQDNPQIKDTMLYEVTAIGSISDIMYAGGQAIQDNEDLLNILSGMIVHGAYNLGRIGEVARDELLDAIYEGEFTASELSFLASGDEMDD